MLLGVIFLCEENVMIVYPSNQNKVEMSETNCNDFFQLVKTRQNVKTSLFDSQSSLHNYTIWPDIFRHQFMDHPKLSQTVATKLEKYDCMRYLCFCIIKISNVTYISK